MSNHPGERRQFSRAFHDLPVEVHQGGSFWHQKLIDLSLAGVATDPPNLWDTQYNDPFTLIIDTGEHCRLELHAYVQHVEAGRLGFVVQHVDSKNIKPLRALLAELVKDPLELEQQLSQLDN